jgi:alpha-tubulin suppressor-like RCC1 family protein
VRGPRIGTIPTVDCTPIPVSGLPPVGQLAIGVETSCAVTQGGAVWCWGKDNLGLLGSAAFAGCGAECTHPTVLPDPAGVTQIAVSEAACTVLRNMALECWGSNAFGQLGRGTLDVSSAVPATVVRASGEPLTGVREVVSGDYHACARLEDGEVLCFGDNEAGQLGVTTTTSETCNPDNTNDVWCSRVAVPVAW